MKLKAEQVSEVVNNREQCHVTGSLPGLVNTNTPMGRVAQVVVSWLAANEDQRNL